MKKSELRAIIRECIHEVLTEAQLNQLFRQFVQKNVPVSHQSDFTELIYPFINKSQENPSAQATIVKKLISAAVGNALSPRDSEELKDYGIDVSDRKVAAKLAKYHPFISQFLKFITDQSVAY